MAKAKSELSFFEVFFSTLAAAFGVQTRSNMERDFSQGEILKFIAAAAIFTVLFVVGLITAVNLIIS